IKNNNTSIKKYKPLGGLFDLEKMSVDIQEYSERMAEPVFWDDPQKAQQVIDESNDIKNKYDSFMKLSDEVEEYQLMLEMVEETGDEDLKEELNEGLPLVDGVADGHEIIVRGTGKHVGGKAPVQTGAAAICPRGRDDRNPVFAGWFNLNGNGEMT